LIDLSDQEALDLEMVKGKKTWKELLLKTTEIPVETILAREMSNGFSLLKSRISSHYA